MRKIYLTLVAGLLLFFTVNAQLNYDFTPISGSYTPLTGGIIADLVPDSDSSDLNDDGYANGIPIGFQFKYNGVNYDTIHVNTNGFASFVPFRKREDSTARANYDYYTPDLQFGPTSERVTRPVLAPLWDDLDLYSYQGITYKTEGSGQNRVFTIQWDSVYFDLTVTGPNPTLSFQIKLYQSTGAIEFHYKQLAGPVGFGSAASIGISGTATGPGNFLSLTNAGISPSALNYRDIFDINEKPASGQIYRFSPVTQWFSQSGDLTRPQNWNSLPDGSGVAASSFREYNQRFILQNPNKPNRLSVDLGTGNGVIDMGGQFSIDESVDLVTGGKLVFKSLANYTGRLDTVPASSTITGNVTVERYMTSTNNRAFRIVSPSVLSDQSIFANWQESGMQINAGINDSLLFGTHITGDVQGRNGLDATGTGAPSLYMFNPVTQGFDTVRNTQVPLLNGREGYFIFIRGDRNPNRLQSIRSSSDAVLRSTGSLLYGNVAFPKVQGNQAGSGRFTLVTNPYAAPINWDKVHSDLTANSDGGNNTSNFTKFYTYLDPNVGDSGQYITVDTAGGSSIESAAGNLAIQPGTGFFIQTRAGSDSSVFTIREGHKDFQANVNVFRSTVAPVKFGVTLRFNAAGRGIVTADGATAMFHDGMTAAFDGDDAEKFMSFGENIGFARDNRVLSIESRPMLVSRDTLFLQLGKLKAQQYDLKFSKASFDNAELKANLVDRLDGSLTPLDLSAGTVVPFTVTKDPASYASNRFYVVFSTASVLPLEMTDVKAYQNATGIKVEWNTSTESNMDKYEVEKSSNGQVFTKIGTVASKGNSSSATTYGFIDPSPVDGANYYRIRSVSKEGSVVYSQIIKVTTDNGKQIVTIYPNPVRGGIVNVQMNNLAKGKYNILLINDLGQQVYNNFLNHQGGTVSYQLKIGNLLPVGLYQMRMFGQGKIINKQLLIQNK